MLLGVVPSSQHVRGEEGGRKEKRRFAHKVEPQLRRYLTCGEVLQLLGHLPCNGPEERNEGQKKRLHGKVHPIPIRYVLY